MTDHRNNQNDRNAPRTDSTSEGGGHRDVEPSEARPTPGSAEGERDRDDQSNSNIPKTADSDRH
jgi:hypothetical protein